MKYRPKYKIKKCVEGTEVYYLLCGRILHFFYIELDTGFEHKTHFKTIEEAEECARYNEAVKGRTTNYVKELF